jgi:hypothetical protein
MRVFAVAAASLALSGCGLFRDRGDSAEAERDRTCTGRDQGEQNGEEPCERKGTPNPGHVGKPGEVKFK